MRKKGNGKRPVRLTGGNLERLPKKTGVARADAAYSRLDAR
jgi:hypothetical protein